MLFRPAMDATTCDDLVATFTLLHLEAQEEAVLSGLSQWSIRQVARGELDQSFPVVSCPMWLGALCGMPITDPLAAGVGPAGQFSPCTRSLL